MKALTVPPAALADPNAIEMFRVWIAEKGLHCSLRVGMYVDNKKVSETEAWGVIFADAIRQIGAALEAQGVGDRASLVAQISERLDSELDAPAGRSEGQLILSN